MKDKKVKIKLDSKTSLFFAHLVNEGIAAHEQDPNIPEGEVHASIQKSGNKKGKLLIHTNAVAVYLANE